MGALSGMPLLVTVKQLHSSLNRRDLKSDTHLTLHARDELAAYFLVAQPRSSAKCFIVFSNPLFNGAD